MTSSRINLHATALVIGTQGWLITGRSGAGKSRLALHLLADAQSQGLFCALVSDDQVWLEPQHGRVLAARPETIANLIEWRFTGLLPVASVHATVIDCVLQARAPDEPAERLPPPSMRYDLLPGHSLPTLVLRPDFNPGIDQIRRALAISQRAKADGSSTLPG